MSPTGGTNKLFSLSQFCVKASTASVLGHKYLELNLKVFVFLLLANLSMVNGPYNVLSLSKRVVVISQSSLTIHLDK